MEAITEKTARKMNGFFALLVLLIMIVVDFYFSGTEY